jgi:hypothetical protein
MPVFSGTSHAVWQSHLQGGGLPTRFDRFAPLLPRAICVLNLAPPDKAVVRRLNFSALKGNGRESALQQLPRQTSAQPPVASCARVRQTTPGRIIYGSAVRNSMRIEQLKNPGMVRVSAHWKAVCGIGGFP